MTRSRLVIKNQGNNGMTAAATRKLIKRYYSAFNAQDTDAMLDCLGPGFVHDVSRGERRRGKKKFAEFLTHMHTCYHEHLTDIVGLMGFGASVDMRSWLASPRHISGKMWVRRRRLPNPCSSG